MILESVVTSVDSRQRLNIAPMGPTVAPDDQTTFLLRPFKSSQTYDNLIQTRSAVIHVTDDVWLIARSATDQIDADEAAKLVFQIAGTQWWPLVDCHRWFAVEVESIDDHGQRADIRCRVVRSEVVRPFFGFNRAKHAVVEAAILATRTHLLGAEEICNQLQCLQPLVDKTGGTLETAAFEFLKRTIDDRLAHR